MRPGFGTRHPAITELLASGAPVATFDGDWVGGQVVFKSSAHLGLPALPEELVLSVRCIVRVGDCVVLCRNRDGIEHPWPGGRLEPGESHVEAGCREVHEETGWLVEPTSFEPLGWLHFHFFNEPPPVETMRHPDALMVVYACRATTRDDAQGGDWTDTEGFELSSRLVSPTEAMFITERDDPLSAVYLAAIAQSDSRRASSIR